MIEKLRPTHPRLIFTVADLARVRALIDTDATAARYWESILAHARDIIDEPTLTYNIVGPRLLHESRKCVDRVYTLALAYRLTGEDLFADRAVKEMLAAADLPDWNPSHFLDTAEMTHGLAIGYDWLYDYLGDELRARIREAMVRHGLNPGRECYEGEKYGWWHRSDHNWNQVCNGGLALGALAIGDEEPELCDLILTRACESLPKAMESYAPDGGWEEGPAYWHYATRYTVYFLAALESALGSDQGLSQFAGFDRTGDFRMDFCGPSGKAYSYADGGDSVGSAEEMYWLARRFGRPEYAMHQAECIDRAEPLDLIWYVPVCECAVEWYPPGPQATVYRGIDVAFLSAERDDPDALWVAVKGGDNQANHSHLDLGSFVLDAGGKRWAIDLGRDYYNLPGYFGQERWGYYRLRTESHNTVLINGSNQNVVARAPIVADTQNPDFACIVADLSAAYDAVSLLKRGIALIGGNAALIQDEIRAPEPVEAEWGMVTPADVLCDGDRARLILDGAVMQARILSPDGAVFDTVSTQPPEPEDQNEGTVKLVVRLPQAVDCARIAVLLWPGEQDIWPPAVLALDDWVT